MRKKLTSLTQLKRTAVLLLSGVLFSLAANAQNYYDLNFVGSGEYEAVSSIQVENLTKGTSMNLNGNEVLRLTLGNTNSIEPVKDYKQETLTLFPNPSQSTSLINFTLPYGENVQLSIYDLSGRIQREHNEFLAAGNYSYRLPAMPEGLYAVIVNSESYRATAKWICTGTGSGDIIEKVSEKSLAFVQTNASAKVKLTATKDNVKEMKYAAGDLLRLTGKAGNCTTILMKRITVSQEIDFRFIACTDSEGKHYAIVKVGDLFWMAENLQAKKTGMQLATSQNEWKSMSDETPGMAYLHFDDKNKSKGAYYNYEGALMAMPSGWRLPSAGEVNEMETLLNRTIGGNVSNLLKAHNSDTWNSQPTGIDETTFGADALGYIQTTGAFARQGTAVAYWTKNKAEGKGYIMEIGSTDASLINTEAPVELTAGYVVRGVVDAPSAYAKLLDKYFTTKSKSTKALEVPILGSRYVITEESKDWVLFDSIATIGLPMVRQMVGQTSEKGTDNTVIVAYGNNKLSFHIYNAAKTKTATKEINLITNATHAATQRGFTSRNNSNTYYKEYESEYDMQVISKDINSDGIGDFIVAIYNKVVIIDGAAFTITAEKSFTVSKFLRIALADVKNAGTEQLLILNGATLEMHNDFTFKSAFEHFNLSTLVSANLTVADMVVGDVTGNEIPNVILTASKSSYCYNYTSIPVTSSFAVLEYRNNNFQLLYKNEDITSEHTYVAGTAAPRFRGRNFPCDIVAGSHTYRYNTAKDKFEVIFETKNMYRNDGSYSPARYENGSNLLVGNFDKNEEGKEQLIYLSNLYVKIPSNERNTINSYVIKGTATGELSETTYNEFPAIKGSANYYYRNLLAGAINLTGHTRVLEHKLTELTFSEPRIHALMAAPPYYTDYEYSFDMGTSWGKSSMTGSEKENASTTTASAIFGFEMDLTIPVIGTKVGGIEFETKLAWANSEAFSQAETVTKTNTFTASFKDAVVLTAVPYETHIYTIKQSYNPDEVGSDLLISIPKASQTLMITLDDFEALTSNDPKVPNLRSIFKHTVGDPLTYPRQKSEIVSNAKAPFVYFGGAVEGAEMVNIGSGGNLSREVSLDKEQSQSSSSSFEMEMELVYTNFGVKAGGGFGYEKSNTVTTTMGEGHTVAGTVAGLDKYGEMPEFKWNLAWFNYTLGGQTFPVVYYVVQPAN